MSKQLPQKFLSVKCFRDSTGVIFFRAIGSLTDPVTDILLVDSKREELKFQKKVFRLKSGFTVIEARLSNDTKTLSYEVSFDSGDSASGYLDVPTDSQRLISPVDSLIQSFSVEEDRSNLTFSFNDTLGYENSKEVQSVIYPSSEDAKLDTSNTKDFYYLSDVNFVYVASNDLQNKFLNDLGYEAKGVANEALGRFHSRSKNQILKFAVSSVANPNLTSIDGPVVYGELKTLSMPPIPRDGSGSPDLEVCTTFGSSNYYLNGCTDLTLPCVDSGETHSDDCGGTILTAEIINNATGFINGGCCTDCDTPNVQISNIENATAGTADGSALITFTNDVEGDRNLEAYSISGVPSDPLVSFSTINVHAQVVDYPYSITYSTFPAGTYEVNIGTGGCSGRYVFTIGERRDSRRTLPFGCTDNTAINYDDTVGLTGFPELCVFCDAVTGKFTAGGVNDFTSPFPQVLPAVTTTNATSTVAGVTNTDGILQFDGTSAEFSLWGADPIGIWNLADDDINPNYFEFSLADNLSSSQDLPFVHKLYKLDIESEQFTTLIAAAAQDGESTKDVVVNNSTLIATQTGNGNQEHTFSGLAAGKYVVITQYQTDAALDGSAELEQCYSILGEGGGFSVGIQGCTDPNSLNYNADATIDDGSCNYESEVSIERCGAIDLGITLECGEDYDGRKTVNLIGISPFEHNPNLLEVLNAGQFTYTQGPRAGEVYPDCCEHPTVVNNTNFPSMLIEHYLFSEVFCHDLTNNTQLHLDNWIYTETGFGPNWALGPLDVQYMYFPIFGNNDNNISFIYGGDDATYTLFDSNGNPPVNSSADPLNSYLIVNLTVNYADGTSGTTEVPLGRWFAGDVGFSGTGGFSGGGNTNVGYIFADCNGNFNNPFGQQPGPEPVSYSYNYNWGSFDNPEYTYQSDLKFFEGGEYVLENGGAVCCDPSLSSNTPECTDPAAINYCCPEGTAGVITDNSLCEYPEVEEISGCTDPTAPNFNPEATVDDGSCDPIEEPNGAWVCENAAAGTCDFIPGLDPTLGEGYASQIECEAQCSESDPDDCLELSNWVNTNSSGMTATPTNSSSTLNEITGLCDPANDGTVVINIPDNSDLNIENPNTVIFQLLLWDAAGTQYANYFENGTQAFDNNTSGVTSTGSGDYLSLSSYAGQTFTFTNVIPGCYNYAIRFWSDAIPHVNTGELVPSNTTQYCEGYNNNVCVGIDDCAEGSCVHGCMDPEADNYDPNATCQDVCTYPCDPCEGECLCPDGTYGEKCCPEEPVCGCMDPEASNFNPAATIQNLTCPCEYDLIGESGESTNNTSEIIPACIPKDSSSVLNYNNNCITTAGHRFYTKLITGLADDCSILEPWKMIIIQEILEKKGLPCVYNCTDHNTPNATDAANDCNQKWIDGGSLYWNPADSASFSLGTVVKRANGGLGGVIYIAVSNSGLNIDPFSTETTTITSGWKKCVNLNIPTDTETYLQKFVSFARSYCRDCGVPPYPQEIETNVEVVSDFTVGGSPVTNDGVTYTQGESDTDLDSENGTSSTTQNI